MWEGIGDFLFGTSGGVKDGLAYSGKSGAVVPLIGAGLNYYQADKARNDKIKMFDKQFGAEQDQLKFQNNEYLDKKRKEQEAWNNFQDPYANIV